MTNSNPFFGPNEAYILDLYERFQANPLAVDGATRAFFEVWTPPQPATPPPVGLGLTEKVVGAANYAQALREYGHLDAQLDPLASQPVGDPSLKLATHGLTEADLRALPSNIVGGPIAARTDHAWDALQALKLVYSSKIGYDYDHIRDPEERAWLRHAAESRQFSVGRVPIKNLSLLDRLTQVEAFEQFIHRIFPGKHRFSIEGLDIMVPMLDVIIGAAAATGVRSILMGMAHRGRLNVLAHILGKPYAQMLAEFKDPVAVRKFRDDLGWTGDVKYHSGASKAIHDGTLMELLVTLAPNPSHLEAVNPVVEGMSRASGTVSDAAGVPTFDPHATMPILIHGDAAFPGQGIVAETLNMSRLPGYWTGGTIHIIANNQLGYTTEPTDSRSTIYASDLAKGFKMPIVHVNADDPEACLEVARLAFAYQEKFERDFIIDLIGYRRYGHNEGDEPAFTQPMMYKQINQHPTARQIWANTLVSRRELEATVPDALLKEAMSKLQQVYESVNPDTDLQEPLPEIAPKGTAKRSVTAVPVDQLQALNHALMSAPKGFSFHPKLSKARNKRLENADMPDAKTIEWTTGEELAFASILADGTPIRLTGQDVQRGTFNQRHAVFHDPETGVKFVPLQNLPQATAAFEIHNSPLTEDAALGFEYGYNIYKPNCLVLWEAQYGDFNNGGQTIIDEFILSGRAKWGQEPSLVLLLPHGYEGAGPDHSSARLERFLQNAAETNMRVAYPTTAAQYFHLLRRQALLLTTDPLPLIVMTPKSLLRNEQVASTLRDLAEGHWQPVIDDARAVQTPQIVETVLLCSGKVYIDLITSPLYQPATRTAIVRVEQLYPLPIDELRSVLAQYSAATNVVWVQEEPENMGAYEFVRPMLQGLLDEDKRKLRLHYVGRARSSSPAEGSASWHQVNQKALLKRAFGQASKDTIETAEIIIREK